MYISARARLHDGSNSHHDGAGLLHRGANGCIRYRLCWLYHTGSGVMSTYFYHPIPVFVPLQSGLKL
jgi:hypothetical protein